MKALVVLALLLGPSTVWGAGFAESSLFLSRTPVTEGESVLVHAVVSNSATTTFSGKLVFKDGETIFGTTAVSLGAGEAETLSASWQPSAGSHNVSAELQSADGSVSGTEKETFSIKEKPQPKDSENQSAATVESSGDIQKSIANISPQAQEVAEPAFVLIDSGRSAAADFLDDQIATAKTHTEPKKKPSGEVEGAETYKLPDTMGSFWSILWTLYLYLLTIVRFIIGSAGIFYPVLAVAFFYILWRTYKKFRRV